MTNKIQDAFLILLKMGLWNEYNSSISEFSLNAEDWSLIFEVAVSQTVEGIVYEGILLMPSNLFPPHDLLFRWTARLDTIERNNKKMRETISVLSKGFQKNNIDFILLKGLGLAENYHNPLSRVSGDIDLFFCNKDLFNKANQLLTSRNYKVYPGDHHSTFYTFNGVEVEHHTKMVDIFNPFRQKYIDRLLREDKPCFLEFHGATVRIPSYILNQVQANAHILKHYMGFGIGLRQFCDIARLCFKKPESFDGEKLRNIYKTLKIDSWMNVIHNFMVNELGLPKNKLPYQIESSIDTSWLMHDVLASGNFGFHDVRFRNGEANLSERYDKRDNAHKRILPHIKRLIRYAPYEVIWYPVNKIYTKISGR